MIDENEMSDVKTKEEALLALKFIVSFIYGTGNHYMEYYSHLAASVHDFIFDYDFIEE